MNPFKQANTSYNNSLVANALDCDDVVSEFKLSSNHDV